MKREQIEFLSAVLLVSNDAERLARFYRDTLGIPLEEEQHGDTLPHWGCTMGDVHFAIHPFEDFPDHTRRGVGAVKLAFTVFDLAALHRRLLQAAVNVLYPPRDEGYFVSMAVEDPDGNFVELTQMSDEWFEHLAKRRAEGHDVLARRKASGGRP
jgi:catechol-2,3-dioxygenase